MKKVRIICKLDYFVQFEHCENAKLFYIENNETQENPLSVSHNQEER